MTDKVLRFCREQQLLSPGDTVTCAVSGGPDSLAMLLCLLSLRETLAIEVRAAHFHHGLRGAAADADEAFVRDFCAARSVPLTVGHGDAAARAQAEKETLEEAARALRYAFLLSCPGKIATAHTAGDNAETVLLNLTRGAGLRGLAGIPPARGRIIRPLLSVTRGEVLAYLREAGVPFRTDESNETDFCRRNRVRRHVVPLLEAENPAFSATVLQESLLLRAEDDFLEREAAKAEAGLLGAEGLDCAGFRALHEALQRRVLRRVLRPCGRADAKTTEAVRALALSPASCGRQALPGGFAAVKTYGRLRICGPAPAPLPERRLPVPGLLLLPELSLLLCASENPADFSEKKDTYLLNYDMIKGELLVRARKTGDQLCVPAGHKSVKRLMIDRKIPAERRGLCPVFVSGGRVLAVLGLGVSRDCLPVPGRPALAIHFTKTEKGASHNDSGY